MLYNLEHEKLVLGSVILRGETALGEAMDTGLEPGHFKDNKNRLIYRAAIDLAAAGKPVDVLQLQKALAASGQAETVGIPYLAGLDQGMPLDLKVGHYAAEIVQMANRRQVLASAENLQTAALQGNGDFGAAIIDVEKALVALRSQGVGAQHRFETIADDRYRLTLPGTGTTLEVDRLRREHNELQAELCVKCALPGVKAFDGVLSIADFNMSSARARTERAKLLDARAGTKAVDWPGALEELCQRVLAAERQGKPAVDLRTLERPGPDDSIRIDGLSLPRRHPAILFGDGGAAKSYLALHILGALAQRGMRVGLFDWELAGEDHRDRLERLFGPDMPEISYVHCERPLTFEVDRLARIVRDRRLEYCAYDSAAFACDGPPESAEVAGRYFRAVRQIGIGGLHVAHITKSDGGDQKPFGSVFFHNGARATYFCKLAETSPGGETIQVGLYPRKNNLSGPSSPIGYEITFRGDRTLFVRVDPANSPELAESLTTRQRMAHILRGGKMGIEELADTLSVKPDTIRRTVARHKTQFVFLEGGQVALLQRVA